MDSITDNVETRRKTIAALGLGMMAAFGMEATKAQAAALGVACVATIATLRTLSPSGAAVVLGRTSVGDGGGIFYWDASSTLTEDGGVVFQSTVNNGAPGRWIRLFESGGGIHPIWFGCISDGTADDTQAFQAAANAGLLWQEKVRVPQGVTRITSDIQLSGNPVLEGDSPQSSSLLLTNNSGLRYLHGQVSEFSSNNQVEIRHLGVRSGDVLNSGALIDLRFTGGAGTTSQSVVIEDVEITGYAGNNGFKTAVYLFNARNIKIRGMRVSGNASIANWDGIRGLDLDGDAQPVEFYITDCNFYNVDAGIYVNGQAAGLGLEGVYISQCSFVSCNYGVYATSTATHPLIKVAGSQFNCFYSDIYVYNFVHLMITGNVFYAAGPRLNQPHVTLAIGSNQTTSGYTSIVTNNIFIGSNFVGQPKNGITIGGVGSFSIVFSDNYIDGYDTPISIYSGVSGVVVTASNQLQGNSSNCVLDQGTNNNIAVNRC